MSNSPKTHIVAPDSHKFTACGKWTDEATIFSTEPTCKTCAKRAAKEQRS
jgi:hypothetical protein